MFDAKTANAVEVYRGTRSCFIYSVWLLKTINKDWNIDLQRPWRHPPTCPWVGQISWVQWASPDSASLFTQWGSDSKFGSQWVPRPCWPAGVPCSLATFLSVEIPPDQKPGTNFGNIVDPMSNTQQRMQKDQKISGSSWERNRWWVRGPLHRVPCLWAVSCLGLKLWIYYQNHYVVVLKTWVCIKQL